METTTMSRMLLVKWLVKDYFKRRRRYLRKFLLFIIFGVFLLKPIRQEFVLRITYVEGEKKKKHTHTHVQVFLVHT